MHEPSHTSLPVYQFKRGEPFWQKGRWYVAGDYFTRKSSQFQDRLTVKEAERLSLIPKFTPIEGWVAKIDILDHPPIDKNKEYIRIIQQKDG